MSTDTAFAAQFWLWPDPAMKRDAQGRILFVNAAFLQLYGGTVEAWTGNVIQGWPAPQPLQPGMPPVAHRFETRMPAQNPDMGEQIYDWIEQTELDGSAFALARNVSVYTQIVPTPPSGQPMQPPIEAAPQIAETFTPQEEVQQTPAPTYAQAPQRETERNVEPVMTAPPVEAPQVEATQSAVSQLSEPLAAPSSESSPDTSAETMSPPSEADAQAHTSVQNTESSPAVPSTKPEIAVEDLPAPAAETQREERDFERRALPIESNSAVLGNNWRDAVIAKAVGVETATPDEEVQKKTAPAEKTSGNADGPRKILLAEDNAINALLTRTLLEAEGHTVETVEDGALAVEAMKTQSYDLIFMDMRMPNMDGLEATRKIRQLPNVSKDLPIVALTANAFDDDRNACFDSGMNDFMTKPVSAEELSTMVKNWTGKKDLDIAV